MSIDRSPALAFQQLHTTLDLTGFIVSAAYAAQEDKEMPTRNPPQPAHLLGILQTDPKFNPRLFGKHRVWRMLDTEFGSLESLALKQGKSPEKMRADLEPRYDPSQTTRNVLALMFSEASLSDMMWQALSWDAFPPYVAEKDKMYPILQKLAAYVASDRYSYDVLKYIEPPIDHLLRGPYDDR